MKVFELILFVFLATTCTYGQNVETIFKFACPLENGAIKKINRPKLSGINPTGDIAIVAENDSIVFAIEDGIINKIIEGALYEVIVKKDSLFFVYKGLSNIVLKENDTVKKGDKIGFANKCSNENNYQVKMEIWNNIDKINMERIIFTCK